MIATTITPHERATTNRLSALVDRARELRAKARVLRMTSTAAQCRNVAMTLDGARTRLIEDGTEYLDAADAFVSAGADAIADIAARIGRCARG